MKQSDHSTLSNPYRNPYAVLQPTDLYGRAESLNILIGRVIRQRSSLNQQIVGLRGVGKTSLLNVFAQLNNRTYARFAQSFGLAEEQVANMLFVQVDCDETNNEAESFWELLGWRLVEAEDNQMATAGAGQSRSALARNEPVAYRNLMMSLDRLLQAGKQVVFLLDDFDLAAQSLPIEVLLNLRHMSYATHKEGSFLRIITATHRPLVEFYRQRKDAMGIASPSRLLNFFDPPLFLGLLEETTERNARAFIEQPAAEHGVPFSAEDIAVATILGGRHPDLTRQVCQLLFDARHAAPAGTPDPDQILHDLLARVQIFFEEVLQQGLSAGQRATVVKLAAGQDALADAKALKELQDYGLVVNAGGKVALFSPVLHDVVQELLHQEQPSPAAAVQLVASPDDEIIVWPDQQTVQIYRNPPVRLTANEWKVFAYLWDHADQVVDRQTLSQLLNAEDKRSEDTLVYMTVKRLRAKIEHEQDGPKLIQTVHGQGYLLKRPATP